MVEAAKALAELTRFSAGAKALVGHNLIEHDLRYVRDADPRNALLDLPVIDTLPDLLPREPLPQARQGIQAGGMFELRTMLRDHEEHDVETVVAQSRV